MKMLPRPRSSSTASFLFLLLLLLRPVVASAEDPAVDEHYNTGVKAFQDAEYEKSAAEMRASLAAHPTAKAALYLGNAYLKLGRLGQAKEALKRVLTLAPHDPKREAILTLIRSIDARTVGKVLVTSFPAGATIYVDSEATPDRGKAPQELAIPPGHHAIIAVLDGYETQTLEAEAAGGEAVKVDFTLRAKGCDLALTAEPAACLVSIDGAPAVALGEASVPTGGHKVAVTCMKASSRRSSRSPATAPIRSRSRRRCVPMAV